jgi:hypothetical protein
VAAPSTPATSLRRPGRAAASMPTWTRRARRRHAVHPCAVRPLVQRSSAVPSCVRLLPHRTHCPRPPSRDRYEVLNRVRIRLRDGRFLPGKGEQLVSGHGVANRLARNPAKGVRLPRIVRREIHFLTAAQLEQLAEVTRHRSACWSASTPTPACGRVSWPRSGLAAWICSVALHAEAAVYQRVPTLRWPPSGMAKGLVGDQALVVEVGRLELLVACLLHSRSEGCRCNDLRFVRASGDRCCPLLSTVHPSAADPARTSHAVPPSTSGRQGRRARGCSKPGGDGTSLTRG